FHDFLEHVRSVPGVQSAALTEIVPLSQDDMNRGPFVIQEMPASDVTPSADYRNISPGYFQTMQIPLLQGRSLWKATTHRTRKWSSSIRLWRESILERKILWEGTSPFRTAHVFPGRSSELSERCMIL